MLSNGKFLCAVFVAFIGPDLALPCPGGYWGDNCGQRCPINCYHDCNETSGICDACARGYWGKYCNKTCPDNCYLRTCRIDGVCDSCRHGYWGSFCNKNCLSENCEYCNRTNGVCNQCQYGFWGYNCTNICRSENCQYCDRTDGVCGKCKHGFWGSSCNDTCVHENCQFCDRKNGLCNKCQYGFWSSSCNKTCRPENCRLCSRMTGVCDGCKLGLWGSSCNETCHENCHYCHKANGVCGRCKNGFWGSRCHETCRLENCLYCDKANGICGGCSNGFWGSFCNNTCPGNCSDNNTCQKTNGKCYACQYTGYFTDFCNVSCSVQWPNCATCGSPSSDCITCADGYWGKTCETKCHNECPACYKNSGVCKTCMSKHFGENCTCDVNYCRKCGSSLESCDACENGYWGSDCDHRCILTGCLNSRCEKKTGFCEQCNIGFWGNFCNNSCEIKTCANSSGSCSKAAGSRCYNCKTGFWGNSCGNVCPENCSGSCNRSSGYCMSCKHGFSGSFCNCSNCDKITNDKTDGGMVGIGVGAGVIALLFVVAVAGTVVRQFYLRSKEIFVDTTKPDTVWITDALTAIIAAKECALKETRPALKWKDISRCGVIANSIIIDIFKKSNKELFEHHEHVIRLMENYLFIACPAGIPDEQMNDQAETSMKIKKMKERVYIMPCIVQEEADKNLLTSPEGKSSSAVLCMIPVTKYLPPTVFQKVLALCITKWPIAEQHGQMLIFSGACKFNIDEQRLFKLTVFLVKSAIHAKIVSYVDVKGPGPAVCEPVKDFLTKSLRSVLQDMECLEEFSISIQCPQYNPTDNGGYLDINLMEGHEHITCDDCKTSHVLNVRELLGYWMEMKPREDAGMIQQNVDNLNLVDGGPITHEHLNHTRLCNALVTVCADGLRAILLCHIPPGHLDFHQLLLANEPMLRRMKCLRQEQLQIIFPDPQNNFTGTVDQFDITLLCALIRNISGVTAPVSGWGKPPIDNPRDSSLAASVERIRLCRNNVIGHSVDYKIDDNTFENIWGDIEHIMDDIEHVLGDKGYSMALQERKNQVFTVQQARYLQQNLKGDLQAVVADLAETLNKLTAITGGIM